MRQSGNTMAKTSTEMEGHMFAKAQTRDEYLGFVARLIIHVRDTYNKKAGVGPAAPGGAVPGMGSAGMQDPIGALQNLTKTGLHQPPMSSHQPGMVPSLAPGMSVPQRGPFQTYQQPGMSPQSMHQRGPLPPHMQQQPGMQGPRAMDAFTMMGAVGTQSGGTPQSGMVASPMQHQQPQHNMQQFGAMAGVSLATAGGMATGRPPTVSSASGLVGTTQPYSNTQLGNNAGGAMQPSPHGAGGLTGQSPGSFISQPSPMGAMGPSPGQAISGAPSPGGPLNTPGNPYSMGPLPSPAQGTNLPQLQPTKADDPEERRYLEKLKQLSKYVEPLKRMIRRIEHDEDRKRDQIKMKNLLEILLDTKRMPFSGLIKCEEVLKKLDPEFQKYPSSTPGVTGTTTTTATSAASGLSDVSRQGYVPLAKPGDPLCQTLLDTVAAHIKSPVLNHTLQRTFGPAIQAINGSPIRSHSPPAKKLKRFPSPSPRDIPQVLQGEIARLNHQFNVTLDPLHHTGSSTVHLVCKIDDKHLPTVPPISVSVPENYPKASPTWELTSEDYDSTPFLQRVEKNMCHQMLQLPDRFSVSALLNTWEMSIRRACAPPSAASL